MATLAATPLAIGTTLTAKIERVTTLTNSFIVFLEGQTEGIFLSKKTAAEDFYVHRSQLVGIEATVTIRDKSSGQQTGWLGNFDLPVANANGNKLVMFKQQRAANYQSAVMYAVAAVEEV